MKTLPAALVAASQQIYQTGYMRWFLTLAIPSGPTERMVNHHVNLTYDGNEYTAYPFDIGAVRHSKGELPAVDITVSNVALLLQAYMRTYSGLRKSTLTAVYANTELLTADYTDMTYIFEVKLTSNKGSDVIFTVGAPSLLERPIPPDAYESNVCPFRRYRDDPRCGYAGDSIVSISLPSGSPVNVEVTGYAWTADDSVFISDETDLSPSLDGTYAITVVDANHFTIDGTDGDDYAGPYVGGAQAGFATCPRNKYACRLRGNSNQFGGCVACRDDTIRFVARWGR
jgi:phage-related protein